MRSSAIAHSKRWFGILPLILMLGFAATEAHAQPTFSKVFSPDIIGPNSVTTLTFTITNNSFTPVTDIAFTDPLPGGMTIATPSNASTDCDDAILTALDGGTTITFTDGRLGTNSSCTVIVNVTAGAVDNSDTIYTNTTGDLTSSAGNSGPATDDLTIDVDLPGFTKAFSPSSVPVGSRSTLTFTIDNSLNGSAVLNLDFTDNLPAGMEIADPANASTDCGTATIPPTLTADAGTSVIILDANGTSGFPALGIGATCTVTVDVVTTGTGILGNISDDLLAVFVAAGKASATLEVTVTPIALIKEFTDDPTPPGGTATLEFTIENFDRFDAATGVTFTDPLPGGLTFSSLLSNDCGGSVSGTTTLTFSGGTVPAEGSCTIRVSLTAGATPGTFTNMTGAISGTIGGSPVTGNMASDDIFIEPVPILTKEFLEVGTLNPDPVVGAGDDVVLRFTVTNTSATSGATDVEFFDELTDGSGALPPDPTSGFLPFPVTVTLPPVPDPPCGAGSSLALVTFDTDRQRLELTGGSLTAAGTATDSCTFEVTLTIPAGFPAGTYLNTTEEITATVDGATRTGLPASDDLVVVAAPSLLKEFTDDPVDPGTTVTLEFTLTHDDIAPGNATAIGFTDDLTFLTGLVGDGTTVNDVCGSGNGTISWSAGNTLLTFSGGTLTPGEVCTFSVTLTVPAGAAPGSHTNTTSEVTATVLGTTATENPAEDDLEISSLTLTKEFLDDPVIAGGTVTLRFTLNNASAVAATGIFFTDALSAVLPGTPDLTVASGLPLSACGGTLSGVPAGAATFLFFTGGSLAAGSPCSFDVTVDVPAGADDGTYNNTTSAVTSSLGTGNPAVDNLTIDSNLLQLTKEFTDDPVAPGGTVNLRFTLTNLDAANAASGVALTDDLDAVLSGLSATGLPFSACGGTVDAIPDAGTIDFSGGSLTAGEVCSFDVSVAVPGGAEENIYPNTTSGVTGTITGLGVTGDPASDNLVVQIISLTFSKSFDGPTMASGTPKLSFTITNLNAAAGVAILGFTDNLAAVLPGLTATSLPTDPCGTGSALAGTSSLTLTGGELGPSGSCTFEVDLLVPATAAPGVFTNTTSDLFLNGLPATEPATAELTVEGPLDFTKVFGPDTIGPGSISTLTFTIDNPEAVPVSNLAFIDNLPAGMTIATPAQVTNDCNGTVTAPDGGSTIELTGGQVGPGSLCTITVDVISSTVGVHTNTTSTLTSSLAVSDVATADLTVVTTLPGFTKSFAPSTVSLGERSTLTLTIDNSANDAAAVTLDFTDNLPTGMEIADPATASTDCGTATIPPTLTADAGTSVITLDANGIGDFPALEAGATCTVIVDVVGTGAGSLGNTTEELFSTATVGGALLSSGKAGAVLEVTVDPITLIKEFTDDPTPPGATVTLEFTIENFDRTESATNIAFDDNLETTLTGLAPDETLPKTVCNGGTLDFASDVLSLTGGSLAAEGLCTFSVTLLVPAGSTPGQYPNTTSSITADVGGSGVTGDPATDDLFVEPVPKLTKLFVGDPVGGGDDVIIRFTIENTSTTSSATDIEFLDELTTFLPFPVTVVLPTDPCGTGSSIVLTTPDTDVHTLSLTGGTLDPAPGTGSTCTFDVTLTIPEGLAPGTYVNTTEEITATIDGETVTGDPASDDLVVVAAPSLVKEFTDDPVLPGGTVTLEFTLTNDDPDNAASDIEFSDDLGAALADLTATSATVNTCGGMATSGFPTTNFGYAGGSLTPGQSCTIELTLDVPLTAPAGSHTNTTSNITATVLGVPATGNTATDDLTIASLTLTKEFTDDPVQPGGTVTLAFTIENLSATLGATDITFMDDLDDVLTGLTVDGASVPTDPCGTGSSISLSNGDTKLTFADGILAAGDPPCTFSVTLDVPAAAVSDTYTNTTSSFSATIDGAMVALENASDELIISGILLSLTKEFTDDPVMPGDPVTLEFTLTNLDASNAASDIEFTDDLDAALTGLVATGLPASECGGTVSTPDGGSTIEFSGGTLTGGGVCSFSVSLTVPTGLASSVHTNTTSGVTGTISGLAVTGDPASDDLVVTTTSVAFTKSFDGITTATGTPMLTFTITNLDDDAGLADLGFTDDLDAMIAGLEAMSLPANPCGAGSSISGAGFLTFTGGSLAASGSCSFDVELLVPETATAGTFTNTTSELFADGVSVADAATDDLTVEPPPTFAKVFDPDAILIQEVSTLTFTIDNSASALDATDLDFTDTLPAGVEVAGTPNASTDCTGGTLTATAGASVITYTGGAVAAGASCTVSVDVTGTAAGMHTNTTGDLTSSSGNSGTATDDLDVADPPDIAVTKTDDGEAEPGQTIAYTVVITNSGGGATDVVFNDTVDDNTTLVCNLPTTPTTTQGTVTTCDDSTGEVTVDVGTLAAGSVTITFEAIVDDPLAAGIEEVCNQGTASGSNFDDVVSDDPDTGPADDETCVTIDAAPDLTLTKDDGDATVMPGNDVTYTLTYENTGNQDATGVVLTETVPDNTTYAAANTEAWSCTSGDPAGTTCTLAVGAVAAGAGAATASFVVTVDNPVPAGVEEITNDASVADDEANGDDPNPADNDASDTTPIDAMPEVMAEKSDALTDDVDEDGLADPGDTISYTVVITNNGDEDATDVAFTDTVDDHTTLVCPAPAPSQGSVTMCDAGTGALAVDVGMIAGGGGTATITFDVVVNGPLPAGIEEVCNQGLITDNFPDTPTDDPDVGGASDETCTPVDAAPDLTLTKDDSDVTVMPGDDIAYTLTYENTGNQDATGVVLTETVPDNTTFNDAATSDDWMCTPDDTAGSTCTLAIGAVAAGAGSATASFVVTVDDPVPADVEEITNDASVTDDEANGDDPNPADNDASDTTPIDAAPEVDATKTDALAVDVDGDGLADPGDTIEYTIVISNTGNQGADTVVLTDTPGAHTTLVVGSVVAPGGTIVTGNTAGDTMVEVNYDEIDGDPNTPVATATVTFRVLIDSPFPDGVETVANQGSVDFLNSSGLVAAAILTDDPDTPAPDDPTVTEIDRESDLRLTKRVDNPTPTVGTNVVFTLALTNLGPITNGAKVRDVLPVGLTFISANPADEYQEHPGEWKPGLVAPGDSSILLITARVDTAVPVTNVAEIFELAFPDPDESNNSDSVTVTPMSGFAGKENEAGMTLQEAEAGADIPEEFELGPNYPNPFNPDTVLPLGIPEATAVTMMVYDMLGRRVATLIDGTMAPGRYQVTWRAANLPTGIYIVRLQAGSIVKTRRVTLLK